MAERDQKLALSRLLSSERLRQTLGGVAAAQFKTLQPEQPGKHPSN